MSTYHETPFTLEPETVVPEGAPLSAGMDEATAEAVEAVSAEYAPDSKIDVAVELSGPLYVTVRLTPASELVEGYEIDWDWGDGRGETASPGDLVQGHQYLVPGRYQIVATIRQSGLASIDLSIDTATAEPPPPEPEPEPPPE